CLREAGWKPANPGAGKMPAFPEVPSISIHFEQCSSLGKKIAGQPFFSKHLNPFLVIGTDAGRLRRAAGKSPTYCPTAISRAASKFFAIIDHFYSSQLTDKMFQKCYTFCRTIERFPRTFPFGEKSGSSNEITS
ncbi:MAG: hypothetical protein FWC43_12270, partial [Planctomycetaceae bacterium]|nr:hypothetical protein [Planctomycetaceae bacterium]